MAKQDDFEAHVRRMQELKESGSMVKNTGPLDLTKFSYKSVQKRDTPVQNRRLFGEFTKEVAKKPFDTDILVDQNLEPIKYKGLTGDIKGMSGIQSDSGPVKSQQKKVGQKRYIDESKIKTIMSFLSQQVEEIGERAMESRKPLTKPVEYVDRQGNLKKKNIPLRPRQIESGKGKIVLGTEGYQWVADSKGSYPTVTSMSSSGMSKTAFEMVEEAIGKAWKKAVQVGYHEFQTKELKANIKTGKKFDRNIRVSPDTFKSIIQERLIPTLYAKSKDPKSSFSLTQEEFKSIESMQGQVVIDDDGIMLRRRDQKTLDFAKREPRGGDAIHWDETVGFRDDGYDPGKHMSGEDISDNNISRGVLPGTDPVLGKELERTKHKQPFLPLDEDPSYLSSMEIDPQKDAAKQLLHGVLMDEVLEDARKIQHVQAASATGREEVDQNRVIQRVSEDFEFFDEAEKTRVMEQHNNPITISEESIDKKAVYQESTNVLKKFQQGQVKQLRGVDPILSHLVLRGAQTQKAINPPVQDPGKSVKKKNLKAIYFKPDYDSPSVEVKPSETIAFPEVQQQKKLSALRTDASLEEKKVDTEARDTQYEQSKQDLKKLNVNQLAVSHLASKGIMSEFVSGPEPAQIERGTPIERPMPKSVVLTDAGPVQGELLPKSGLAPIKTVAPPQASPGKSPFPVQQQASLFEGETIDMKQSKLSGDWMTRQEQLRRGEQALHGKINPKMGMFAMGLNLLTAPLQGVFAYKDAERFNYESTEPPGLVPAVTGDQWKQQFMHRMSMGAIPSIGQIQWAKQRAIQEGMIQ
ncbi:hypothetical protein [uncultured Mediterranean phage uvMED]|nr:hypothetical protein [uncultured Mediterranean phage uvMED]